MGHDAAQPAGAALVVGASGGIGSAVCRAFLAREDCSAVYAVSRAEAAPQELTGYAGLHWLAGLSDAAHRARLTERLDADGAVLRRVVLCPGLLHGDTLGPERALAQLREEAMLEVYRVSTVIPMLWLAAVEPVLRRSGPCVVAALSARVGSITDNGLGGWYSYRAAKAALNMAMKSASVELGRKARQCKLLVFHPGTTDTSLSKPFQRNVPSDKLFRPEFVAERLCVLMDEQRADGELSFLDWAGKAVPW